jgi:hypothetical protein
MRKTIAKGKRGIYWNFIERLEDLDFADDLFMSTVTEFQRYESGEGFNQNSQRSWSQNQFPKI